VLIPPCCASPAWLQLVLGDEEEASLKGLYATAALVRNSQEVRTAFLNAGELSLQHCVWPCATTVVRARTSIICRMETVPVSCQARYLSTVTLLRLVYLAQLLLHGKLSRYLYITDRTLLCVHAPLCGVMQTVWVC
jgi:hypothetical protein